MKVTIGNYKNWVGPYQIAEKILWWKDRHSDAVTNLGDWLAHRGLGEDHKTWIYKLCDWVESKKHRKVKIKLDSWDTWNMDATLALIILPMLKQLKTTKHGSAMVDLEDVPESMRYTQTEDWDPQKTFEFYQEDAPKEVQDIHDRWDWVLDEMIWAFEQLQPDCDWEDQYWKVRPQIDLSEHPEDENKKSVPVRWKVEGVCDWVGRQQHQDRISNGIKLFGKYYQGLWD